MTPANVPVPFTVSFAQYDVDRMMAKVRDTRLPAEPIVPGASWDYGIDLEWLTGLKTNWADQWSWAEAEKRINKYSHFRVDIEEISLHFVHIRSSRPDAIPLILSHGWPSTFLEFWEVIDGLVEPAESEQPAFHVVIPSMPGYTFSSSPQRKGWDVMDTARVYNSLMVEVLGYKTYSCAAGDWGATITVMLLSNHTASALTAHFTFFFGLPNLLNPIQTLPAILYVTPFVPRSISRCFLSWVYTDTEIKAMDELSRFNKEERGYHAIQGSKPMTLGCALYDDPIGILSWIGEKYHVWSDPLAPAAPSKIDSDYIITQTALYFLTNSIHTSFLPYKEYIEDLPFKKFFTKARPVGVSNFPAEVMKCPRTWLENTWNLVNYKEHARGGHFAAVDNPKAFLEDVRETIVKGYFSELSKQ
ncbi:alpha beta-hydrolase [Phaffia rhodozyma]|uniref:Alpha beta-hydrolase n=1 Tax=Phaffia rhodozyma TaxID=264483 RepID=A0A0F7SXH6_PHARH|nr:alpha beta-hydrolase [Phaffia rhodozyma]